MSRPFRTLSRGAMLALAALAFAFLTAIAPWQTARADPPPALSDGEIAFIYIQANLFEVDKAELGKAQGTSDAVKQHGEMVAKDHRGVVKSFEELLHMNHIKPVETAGSAKAIADHQAVMTNLKSRKGADFDKAYLAHEVANHRAVIEAIKTALLPSLKNEALAGHMQDVLPAFQHHLDMTEEGRRPGGQIADCLFSKEVSGEVPELGLVGYLDRAVCQPHAALRREVPQHAGDDLARGAKMARHLVVRRLKRVFPPAAPQQMRGDPLLEARASPLGHRR